jgi:anti-sigma factor RsiW
MNCTQWEERLSLYIGGDLSSHDAAEVERHLAECAGCQLFASGLRSALNLLSDAHEEAPAPAHFAAVRARVLEQLERERTPFWRPRWIYGLAAALAMLLIAVAVRPARRIASPRPPEVAVARPIEQPLPEAPPVTPRRPTHARRNPPAQKPAASETVTVRLVTDNPDVVLYWISESKGETK